MSFNVRAVTANREKLQNEEAWVELEGPAYGAESSYPLKVYLAAVPDAWGAAWNDSLRRHGRGLSGKKRQRFAQEAGSVLMEQDVQDKAVLHALKKTGCLKKVAFVGPIFENSSELDRWLDSSSDDAEKEFGCAPWDGARDEFVLDSETGKFRLPVSADPHPSIVADDAQVDDLLSFRDFRIAVAAARRELEDEGAVLSEDDAGN